MDAHGHLKYKDTYFRTSKKYGILGEYRYDSISNGKPTYKHVMFQSYLHWSGSYWAVRSPNYCVTKPYHYKADVKINHLKTLHFCSCSFQIVLRFRVLGLYIFLARSIVQNTALQNG